MDKKIFHVYLAKESVPNNESYAKLDLPASPWEVVDALDKVRLNEGEQLYMEIEDYELIRCVRLFPGDAQGEDVLAADYRCDGLTKKNAALKDALDVCLESLRPRFLLEPERLIPVPQRKKLRKELREALLWQGYEENYDSAIRAVFVEGTGWLSPQDVKKQRHLPLVLSYRVDGMTKDGAYLSLEVEPWEYDLLLEQTRDHYKMKKRG